MSRAEKVGLLKMNRNGVFEVTLQNILSTINPLKEDCSKRFQVIDDLRAVVLSIESLRGIQNMHVLSVAFFFLSDERNLNLHCDLSQQRNTTFQDKPT